MASFSIPSQVVENQIQNISILKFFLSRVEPDKHINSSVKPCERLLEIKHSNQKIKQLHKVEKQDNTY